MSKRYSPEHKALVLQKWEANGGDIALTSVQTGIPERTLRQWRQQHQRQLPPPQISERRQLPEFENDLAALDFMRRQILDELLALSGDLQGNFGVTTPYQRIQILSRLLDRLMTLDEHLKPYRPHIPARYVIVDATDEEPGWQNQAFQQEEERSALTTLHDPGF